MSSRNFASLVTTIPPSPRVTIFFCWWNENTPMSPIVPHIAPVASTAPTAWQQSSIKNMCRSRSHSASSTTPSMGRPNRCTTTTATVWVVTRRLIDSGSAHTEGLATSANTIRAPDCAAALAVDIQDTVGQIISAFVGVSDADEAIRAALKAISRPCVPFPTAIAYFVWLNSANSFSKANTSEPQEGAFALNTFNTASRSSLL